MKYSILIILLLPLLSSCIVVKYDEEKTEPPKKLVLSPKPEIPMSDKIVRSVSGDMIGFLPENWFFVNLEDDAPSDIYAVAVNPDYTLSAVFSKMKKIPEIENAAKNNDLVELAKISIRLQKAKSPGNVSLLGNINSVDIGSTKFSTYQVSTTAGALVANVACFYSGFGNAYRFALIPMDIKGMTIPSQMEANTIFESILTTIKY